MDKGLRNRLVGIARDRISGADVSHDFSHAWRVLLNAEKIASEEGADLDVIVPAALFHDLVVYPKNSSVRHKAQEKSAHAAVVILSGMDIYPKEKVRDVSTCISECSFSKAVTAESLESRVVQDADRLEATGAISIMRTFASSGQMCRPFYNAEDPFCRNRRPDDTRFALDLFYTRLLEVQNRMNTRTATKIAIQRTEVLLGFLNSLALELNVL